MNQTISAAKYVHPDFADAVAAGRLKIGTADYYATMESPLADKLDSRVRRSSKGFAARDFTGSSPEARELTRAGIFIGPNAKSKLLVARNNSATYLSPPQYVLCLSRIWNNDHLVRMGCSIVFGVSDVGEFARALQRANPERLGTPAWGKVRYAPRDIDAALDIDVPPDPYVKAPKFFPEMEVRITWTPARPNVEPSFISNSSPEVARLLTRG